MRITRITAMTLGLASLATPALAQQTTTEGEMVRAPLRAPRNALELGLDMGYTQGFGAALGGRRSMGDVAGPGLGLGVGLGYRLSPGFSIAATGQYQRLNPGDAQPAGTQVHGATAGVEATFHTQPFERADPWVSLGLGYRMLWEVPEGGSGVTLNHGFELGKLTLGLDVRPTENVAVAPIIGADLDILPWQRTDNQGSMSLTRGVNAFVFAGVRGRFDMGGTRETRGENIGTTQVTTQSPTIIITPAPSPPSTINPPPSPKP